MLTNNQVENAIREKHGKLSGYVDLSKPNHENQSRSLCPKCSAFRKKDKQKCLSVNHGTGTYHCHNADCGISGAVRTDDNIFVPISKPKVYRKPKPLDAVQKTDKQKVFDWLIGRGIDANNIPKGIIGAGNMYFRDIEKEDLAIIFNYTEDGETKNRKGRAVANKMWAFTAGAELVPYNADAIKRAAIEQEPLVICEGEMDALSWMMANVEDVISCPNGTKNMTWMDKYWDFFEQIPLIYLAYDNDKAGKEATDILVGRFGADKVKIIKYPEGSKDSNEVLMSYGWEQLRYMYASAEHPPVEGLAEVSGSRGEAMKYLTSGFPETYKTGISEDFDRSWSFYLPEVTLVTAPPGSGKSAITESIVMRLATRFGFKFGFLSGEKTIPLHLKGLAHKYMKKDVADLMQEDEANEALDFIQDHFCYYQGKVNDLDSILDVATSMVRRKGINGFVLDNWSVVDAKSLPGESSHDTVGRMLNKIQAWVKKYHCHFFIVAHPKKLDMVGDLYKLCTGYDVSGSSHFFNLVDNGLSLRRNDGFVDVKTWKIRNQEFVGDVREFKLEYFKKYGGIYDDYGIYNESAPVPFETPIKAPEPVVIQREERTNDKLFDELGFD